MFRRASSSNSMFLRAALMVMLAMSISLVLTGSVGAAEPVASTPTAWEYAYETASATERQPATSTSADLRLATGLSIAAVIAMATVVLSDRKVEVADGVQEPTTVPVTSLPLATVRPFVPTEVMPEAA